MSFAAKLYPAANAYIASQDTIEIFDAQGKFKGKQIITILGSEVLEAMTQSSSGTGTTSSTQDTSAGPTAQSGLTLADSTTGNDVTTAGAAGLPCVVFDPVASNYKLPNATVARITIVPEPATIFLLVGGSLVLLRRRRNVPCW